MTDAAPLRVAVVARAVMPLHGVGGLERSVHDLTTHLADRGVRVTLITPPAGKMAADAGRPFASPNVTLRPVPYRTFPLANRRGTTILDRSTAYPLFGSRAGKVALDLVDAGQIDIVHGFGASVLGYARAKRRRAPLVFNPQGLEEFGATSASPPRLKRIGYAPLRRAVLACARAADRIIATDDSLRPIVARHLHAREDQLVTLPNGIDVAAATALAGPREGQAIRTRHGIGPADIVLLSVGRLEANKGFDVLARALGALAKTSRVLASQPWRWVVVGTGPRAAPLRELVSGLGLAPRVLFTGRADDRDLHAWYEAATLFVHPSLYEGSSLVTLEAMAHRRAVIASNAGGLPDKVKSGVNGWLVAAGDEAALARAIDDALSNPGRLETMGEAGRRIVTDTFAWPVLADRQIAMYRELLTNSRRR